MEDCEDVEEILLTSKDCPTVTCSKASCMLYSPKRKLECTSTSTGDDCYTEAGYDTFPGTTGTCEIEFQCMFAIVRESSKWGIVFDDFSRRNDYVAAPLTAIHDINFTYYDTQVDTVELISSERYSLAKGESKSISLDTTFFDTPDTVQTFHIRDVDLSPIISNIVTFPKNWTDVMLSNAKLADVPPQLKDLTLGTLDLSKNDLTDLPPDAFVMDALTKLDVGGNLMESFDLDIPKLEVLNLTSNPLNTFPSVIFGMKSLKEVYLEDCGLNNVQLSEEQYQFLTDLSTFSMPSTADNCGDTHEPKTTHGSAVCVQTPEVPDNGGDYTLVLAIAIPVGILILVIIAITCFCMRRRRSKQEGAYSLATSPTMGNTADQQGSDTWGDRELLALRVENREVQAKRLLSKGAFGEVWLGTYAGEQVAIKKLLQERRTIEDAETFAREIKMMSKLDHPKIVRFIGASWYSALSLQAITEFMNRGDLKSLLTAPGGYRLEWNPDKMNIAIDIADALVYLHSLSRPLIHRDLKSRNVLINSKMEAKLSDFGVSKQRSVDETLTAGVGTARWIAPEVLAGSRYNEAADVYSFGVVLSEIDTCKPPYDDATHADGSRMQDVVVVQRVSTGDLQPFFTPRCPPDVAAIALQCAHFDASRRPPAMQVAYQLRQIKKKWGRQST